MYMFSFQTCFLYLYDCSVMVELWLERRTLNREVTIRLPAVSLSCNDSGQSRSHTHASVAKQYSLVPVEMARLATTHYVPLRKQKSCKCQYSLMLSGWESKPQAWRKVMAAYRRVHDKFHGRIISGFQHL